MTPRTQDAGDLFLERAFDVMPSCCDIESERANLVLGSARVVKVALQMPDAVTAWILHELVRTHGRDDLDPAARPGHRDVEAPLSALAVDWPELHRELAVLVAPVADAEDEDVALVALNGLEILDEEAAQAVVVVQELLQRGLCGSLYL